MVVRIAGLPADALASGGRGLPELLAAGERTLAELRAAREALAERIHPLVPAAAPAFRRLLLAVKRDCFNGRSLARHAASQEWEVLARATAGCAEHVLSLEGEIAKQQAAFAAAYDGALLKERRALGATLAASPAFARGLALASRDLARSCRTLTPANDVRSRVQRKAEANLLRYACRAASKLSPFSTFTRIGLGALTAERVDGGVRLHGGEWEARSLVRIKPYLLEKCSEMLRLHPPFRAGLRVVLNNSVTEIEDGRVLYLRPSHWGMDERTGRFSYFPESLVRVGLSGPVVSWLQERVAERQPSYATLLADLKGAFPEAADQMESQIDALLQIGFLILLLPWPTHEGHLEAAMCERLQRFDGGEALAPLRTRLERLHHLETTFHRNSDAVGAVQEMDDLIDGLWQAAAPLGGIAPEVGPERASRYSIYEDVFVRRSAGPAPEVVDVPQAVAEDLVRTVEPLVRLTSVFDHRHDCRHALQDFAAERWPGRTEVGLMELFHTAQPLWREYLNFCREAREEGGWRGTWNPRALPLIDALARHRAELVETLPQCITRVDGVQHMCGDTLSARLEGVPAAFTSAAGGCCLFLQPADRTGTRWMLNRMKEGTGRFGSRFTSCMDPASRIRYTNHMTACGTHVDDGEEVTLLDLRCVQGDTLNIHALQTPGVLTLPGAEAEAPVERQVRLGDLTVRFGAGGPELRDRGGRRFIAAQLGFAFEDYLPTLIKFLCLFGHSEMRAVFPPQWVEREGEATVSRRTYLGNVVLHRATWWLPIADLEAAIAGADDREIFAAVNRWRTTYGVPDRVFLVERVPHPQVGERLQPQYVDFTSPLFVELLRSALEHARGTITLVEALPDPDAFPADEDGRRWAVEIILDSLALRAHRQPPPHADSRPRSRDAAWEPRRPPTLVGALA